MSRSVLPRRPGLSRLVAAALLAVLVGSCSLIRYQAIKPCKTTPVLVDAGLMAGSLVGILAGVFTSQRGVAIGGAAGLVVFAVSATIGVTKVAPPSGTTRVCQ